MSDPDSVLQPIELEVEEKPERIESGEQKRPAGKLRTLVRLSLGGVLLGLDALSQGLDRIEEQPTQPPPEARDLDSVLLPADEWETTLRHEAESAPRQVLVGFALDTQSRLSRTARAILRRGDQVTGGVGRALDPVFSSTALSPVRGPFASLVERGQAQVNYWRALGRAEEAHSRALAQDTAEQLIDITVDTVASDPRVREIAQDIISQQGMGMAEEAVEEVRERTVSSDMLLERPVRSLLRRRPRESLPAPTELISNLPKVRARGGGRR
jgi:hypothetical protein